MSSFVSKSPLPLLLVRLAHAASVNAYFFAGICFLLTASKSMRRQPGSVLYMTICLAASPLILTAYAFDLYSKGLFLFLSCGGLLVGLFCTYFMKRPAGIYLCHLVGWALPIYFSVMGQWRAAAFSILFGLYLATAICFFLTLERKRQGRMVVVTCFFTWSLCFLVHPLFLNQSDFWTGVINHFLDMERFILACGLLLLTLEELNALHEHEALHDMLTGLPNRRLFMACIEQSMARARRNHSKLVLLYLDLNYFKTVNDTWGHLVGDILLRQIADRLHSLTRASDQICRVGGDEFYLLVEDFDQLSQAEEYSLEEYVGRLIAEIKQRIEGMPYVCSTSDGFTEIHASFSVGSVVFPDDAGCVDDLCRIADLRMYADKHQKDAKTMLSLVANP
ncbi:diguanylate cyclase domain-containing protein [Telmatobacter bradus]|uniref:diguanylate cyclase domain-containing protein n=1 Tax=Telmatobacter bradus TaxID=474953 RepID=UPI003B43C16E